jgi:hypothetical protein
VGMPPIPPARMMLGTVTGRASMEFATAPSTLAGDVTPMPVANAVMMDPSGAGFEGPLSVLS